MYNIKRTVNKMEIKALTKFNQAKNKLEEIKGSEQAEYGYVVILGLVIAIIAIAIIKPLSSKFFTDINTKVNEVFTNAFKGKGNPSTIG